MNQSPSWLTSVRSRLLLSLQRKTPFAWFAYFVVPALCLALPGIGVLLAAVWVVLFLWLTRLGLSTLGLRQPDAWPPLLGKAFGIAVLIYLADGNLVTPLLERLLGASKDLSALDGLQGDWAKFAMWLLLGWIAGGVLEEMIFRGFLITIGVRLMGARMTWPLAILGSAVFGLSHLYQGTVGVITTAIISFLFAIVFILSRGNLLLTMFVHGLVNTLSLALAFFGLARLV